MPDHANRQYTSLSFTLSRFSWTEPRSRSANLYLQHFPLWLAMTSSLGQSPRYRLPIYISNISSFGGQSLLTILLLIVSLYSDTSTYDNPGTFLVHLTIVLSLRKAPIGLVYKPAYVFLCPSASSTHQLPSNLVPSLGLSLVSVPTNFNNYAINLQEQQLFFDNYSTWVSPDLSLSWSSFKEETPLDNHWSSGPAGLCSLLPFKRAPGTLRILTLHLSVHC